MNYHLYDVLLFLLLTNLPLALQHTTLNSAAIFLFGGGGGGATEWGRDFSAGMIVWNMKVESRQSFPKWI